MSYELRLGPIGLLTAQSDLSAKQFLGVGMSTVADGQVDVVGAANTTSVAIGLLQNNPKAGETVDLLYLGISKAIVGAANSGVVTRGDLVMLDSAAKIQTVTAGSTKAVIGIALETSTAANQIVAVLLFPGGLAENVANAVNGVAAGYKIARGTATLVSGTQDITSGLTTVVAAIVGLAQAASLNQIATSVSIPTQTGNNAGVFTAQSWGVTAANNATPIASANNTNIDWIAVGT